MSIVKKNLFLECGRQNPFYMKDLCMQEFDLSRINYLKQVIQTQYEPVFSIVDTISLMGGRALLVGGAVRDLLLNVLIKDVDIEVHALSAKQLESILKQFGPVDMVGKSFGVYRLHCLDVDWSLPRTDLQGRKPTVHIDPHMQLQDAFRRRDLTINAIGIDLKSFQLIDPFNGVNDLREKCLRAPDSNLFIEDPLRFFRVIQFISRFKMNPDQELNNLCSKMDVTGVSRERIEVECAKMLLRSESPSRGLRWLLRIGRLKDIFPELFATVGIKQNPEWHPEGDVFEHTMQAVDAAAVIAKKYTADEDRLILLYSALCHDLGKVTTSVVIGGKIRSPGHAEAGVAISKKLLKRITRNKDLIEGVVQLVLHHMHPSQFVQSNARLSRYKRLANRLHLPVNLQMLGDLFCADRQGRNPAGEIPLQSVDDAVSLFYHRAQAAGVLMFAEQPILSGKDIMHLVSPGPLMGKVLRYAYEIQIDEGIKEKALLLARITTGPLLKDRLS